MTDGIIASEGEEFQAAFQKSRWCGSDFAALLTWPDGYRRALVPDVRRGIKP
jgi:hypothetical protein